MHTAHWPQDIVVKAMEEMVTRDDTSCPKASLERKVRAQKEEALKCPRCNSSNTKFCYYNNYSLSQPRYFCKTCRRYWTEGGSLRNIPVGGGSRKNKMMRSSSKFIPQQNPKNHVQENQDLNLGHDFKTINELIQVPNYETTNPPCNSSSASPHHHHLSAMELLTGITSTTASRSLNSNFLPMPNIANSSTTHDPNNTSGFSLPNCLNFSLDGLGSSHFGSFQGVQQTNGKLLFPFQGLNKQLSNTTTNDASQQTRNLHIGDSNGYWNGVIGGGGSW